MFVALSATLNLTLSLGISMPLFEDVKTKYCFLQLKSIPTINVCISASVRPAIHSKLSFILMLFPSFTDLSDFILSPSFIFISDFIHSFFPFSLYADLFITLDLHK